MDTLPYELLHDIVDKLSCRKDLFQIRSLNKTFCAVATPHLFQQITVKNTLTSAGGFSEILQRDMVTQFITAINFHEVPKVPVKSHIDVMGREATSDVEVVLASLASSFARIHELPNLKSLTLSFPCLTGNLTSMEPLRLQWTILSVLSSRSPLPSVTSVNITGMTALYHPVYDLPSFRSLFGSLTSLSIGAAISHDLAEPQFRDPFIKFWEETFQHRMLGSVSHSLTSLKLSSSSFVGVVPRLDFSQVNFPALELLSLKRILFNMDTHIEDFIVRHKGTLRTLWLMDCKIAILGSFEEPEGVPHRWSHIWARFAKELGALVDFDMLSGYRYSARPIHYARIWPGYWNVAVAWYLHYMDEDEPALEALRQLVRSRAAEQAYVRGQSVANWLIDIE